MSSVRLLLCLVLPLLTACGKVAVTSTPGTPQAQSSSFYGEWSGLWNSATEQGIGGLTFRVQDFAGAPVFAAEISHPAMTGTLFQLVFDGQHLELRDQGVPIVVGDLQANERKFVGTYQCLEDAGTWEADWQRALPAAADLSGTWSGEVLSAVGLATVQVTVEQYAASGYLYLRGTLHMPSYLDAPLPLDGLVRLRDAGFDLSMVTQNGVLPQVVIGGFGSLASMQLQTGLVVTSGLPLPFTQAQITLALLP